MNIGPLDSKPVATPVNGDRKASASTPASGATSAKADALSSQASAKVAISSAGSLLASGGSDATFDAAKVDRIAQAIRDGKFQIDADKIAGKLISNAQDLLKRQSQG